MGMNIHTFYYFSLFFYLLIHIGTSAELHLSRNIPWEPDDHYHYIIKAGNLKHCYFSTCKGLNDVYNMTSTKPINHPELNTYKRIQNREFPRFHIYLKTKKDSLEFSIHLDQKSTCYEGHTAHSGDYNGSLLEEEKNRINNQVKNI